MARAARRPHPKAYPRTFRDRNAGMPQTAAACQALMESLCTATAGTRPSKAWRSRAHARAFPPPSKDSPVHNPSRLMTPTNGTPAKPIISLIPAELPYHRRNESEVRIENGSAATASPSCGARSSVGRAASLVSPSPLCALAPAAGMRGVGNCFRNP